MRPDVHSFSWIIYSYFIDMSFHSFSVCFHIIRLMKLTVSHLSFLKLIRPRSVIGVPAKEVVAHPLAASTSIILLGWGGAPEKHMAKQAEVYTRRGFNTVGFAPMYTHEALLLKNARNMSPLYADLDRLLATDQRLIIHSFSNNGLFALSTLLYNEKYKHLLKRSIGIVFDSGPTPFDMHCYSMAFAKAIDSVVKPLGKGGRMVHPIWHKALVTQFTMAHYMSELLQKMGRITLEEFCAYEYMKKHEDISPNQLYLYSDADRISVAERIREFHEYQRERGKDVQVVNFNDSDHILHSKTYPKEYSGAVGTFLDGICEQKK